MSTASAKRVVKNLIIDNSAALLSGITQQGVSRVIYHVSTTRLTPPQAYYYLAIHCKPIEQVVELQVQNTIEDFYKTVYHIEITLIDYIYPDNDENQLYEKGVENADTLLDRIAELVKAQTSFIDDDVRFVLDDPHKVDEEPEEVLWPEGENYHPVYVGTITFDLVLC